jgi:hypothetical protein
MKDSKKILILSNMLVVLFLVCSSSVFTFLSLYQQEKKESNEVINDITHKNFIKNYPYSISENKSSCKKTSLKNIFQLEKISYYKYNQTIDNTNSKNINNNYEISNFFDLDEIVQSLPNDDSVVKMVESDDLYSISLIIQISYAFGLAGLYSNRNVLKFGIY